MGKVASMLWCDFGANENVGEIEFSAESNKLKVEIFLKFPKPTFPKEGINKFSVFERVT